MDDRLAGFTPRLVGPDLSLNPYENIAQKVVSAFKANANLPAIDEIRKAWPGDSRIKQQYIAVPDFFNVHPELEWAHPDRWLGHLEQSFDAKLLSHAEEVGELLAKAAKELNFIHTYALELPPVVDAIWKPPVRLIRFYLIQWDCLQARFDIIGETGADCDP